MLESDIWKISENSVSEHTLNHPGITIEKHQVIFDHDARKALEEMVAEILPRLVVTWAQYCWASSNLQGETNTQVKQIQEAGEEKQWGSKVQLKKKLIAGLRAFWLWKNTKKKVIGVIEEVLRPKNEDTYEHIFIEFDGVRSLIPLIVRPNRENKTLKDVTDDLINKLNARRQIGKVIIKKS